MMFKLNKSLEPLRKVVEKQNNLEVNVKIKLSLLVLKKKRGR